MFNSGAVHKLPVINCPFLLSHSPFVVKMHDFSMSDSNIQAPSTLTSAKAKHASSFLKSVLNFVSIPSVSFIYWHSLAVFNGLGLSPTTQHAFWHSATFPALLSSHFPPSASHFSCGAPSEQVPTLGSKQVPN